MKFKNIVYLANLVKMGSSTYFGCIWVIYFSGMVVLLKNVSVCL